MKSHKRTMDVDARMWSTRKRVTVCLIVLVSLLYFSGRLDPVLYRVGLNFTTCGQNGFGSVYCGSQLTDYERATGQLNNAR